MSDVVIRAEGLGKKYVIGHETNERYTALRDVMTQQARRLLRSARDMAAGRALITGDEREEFWALKDVNFEIRRGDVVGIIGRNGAGKSTLLKVLSRITEPTEGRVTIDGRVASLLEVGTGFHPELTGRENIYLNGAILGMTRAEIRRKFDEIVDFAGVDKFLDTPVKRYSSGMYVRLAFSVAAHLEPEILVVDEVLAVGDAEFQKKCLGKMQDVAGEGRTVLFVSHNLAAVSQLCLKALFLENGSVRSFGRTDDIVNQYAQQAASRGSRKNPKRVGDNFAHLTGMGLTASGGFEQRNISIQEPIILWMDYKIEITDGRVFVPNFHFYREDGSCAFVTNCISAPALVPGSYRASCHIPANFLNDGNYAVLMVLTSYQGDYIVHFSEESAVFFTVSERTVGSQTRPIEYHGKIPGSVRPILTWHNETQDLEVTVGAPSANLLGPQS